MGQFIPLAISLAGAAVSASENQRVARKQDEAQSAQLIQRGTKQRQADERVGADVAKLEASRADDERAQRLGEYLDTLRRGRSQATAGLTPQVGSTAFQDDASRAAADVLAGAEERAGLQARIDAPTLQRQDEAFGYGHLATDLGRIASDVAGQEFINRLRLAAIRRRPEADLVAGTLAGAGKGMAGRGGAGGGVNTSVNTSVNPMADLGGGTLGFSNLYAGGRTA